jgi:hypothetical protein
MFDNFEDFLADPQEFSSSIRQADFNTHNWSHHELIKSIQAIGKDLYGSIFDIQRASVLNNNKTVLGLDGEPISFPIPAQHKVSQLAEEKGIFKKFKRELDLLSFNLNEYKFHLQGGLDLHFIVCCQLYDNVINENNLQLRKGPGSNFFGNNYKDFIDFYKFGVSPFGLSNQEFKNRITTISQLNNAFFHIRENVHFFLFAILSRDDLKNHPFLMQYDGRNFFEPFHFNRGIVPYYTYSEMIVPAFENFISDQYIHQYYKCNDHIENFIRHKLELPLKNESWINEKLLFVKLRDQFNSIHTYHQVRFKWLGRQSIDIYISHKRVAIEFQGIQHNQAVGFFGGELAFEKSKSRDDKKKKLCLTNGVSLIYVYPQYDFLELVNIINAIKEDEIVFMEIGKY